MFLNTSVTLKHQVFNFYKISRILIKLLDEHYIKFDPIKGNLDDYWDLDDLFLLHARISHLVCLWFELDNGAEGLCVCEEDVDQVLCSRMSITPFFHLKSLFQLCNLTIQVPPSI